MLAGVLHGSRRSWDMFLIDSSRNSDPIVVIAIFQGLANSGISKLEVLTIVSGKFSRVFCFMRTFAGAGSF